MRSAYAFHEVGAGYIDVRGAVEAAGTAAGARVAFLAGDTAWSRQGDWNAIADGDSRLRYDGRWRVTARTTASDGSLRTGNARTAGSLRAKFTGTALKLAHPVDTGTMGPSAADLEIDRYTITVGNDATTIRGNLSWTGALDLDLYLVAPNGERVASGATSANPETFAYVVRQPGAYTLEVTGFATIAATYTLTATVTRAISEP